MIKRESLWPFFLLRSDMIFRVSTTGNLLEFKNPPGNPANLLEFNGPPGNFCVR